jgi:aromatic-L-amino-acid decarboxylase
MSSRTPFWGANHPNFSDRGLPLSRSARALKIWMSVQTFGMAAFRQAVSQGMELVARADEYVRESAMLDTLNPASLGIVCFRVNPAGRDLDEETLEKVNRNVLARVFWEDRALISSTTLAKMLSLRLCTSTTTPPGTTFARRWKPPSGSAPRRCRTGETLRTNLFGKASVRPVRSEA